jgi:D-alanyl-D-alanine carboxypeptidase/D-alanyl-D-alanine-endopeptidase (penicillin-binding protein 4)
MFSHALEGRSEIWRMSESGFRGKGARWLPVRQPELYVGEVFRALADTNGIPLDPAHQGVAPKNAEVIARYQSRELRPMLKSMLRYSTNLTAEMVGLAASRAGLAAPETLAASAEAMNAWAAGVAGFAPGDPGFRLTNHSGLAADARLSPRRMVEFLTAMASRQPPNGKRHPRLPGGITDLLRDYNVAAKSIALDYRHLDIVAKTGTMDYVRGLGPRPAGAGGPAHQPPLDGPRPGVRAGADPQLGAGAGGVRGGPGRVALLRASGHLTDLPALPEGKPCP